MALRRVTITGADESVSPLDLYRLGNKFPYVEWGILISDSKRGGVARFPSAEWMNDLRQVAGCAIRANQRMNLSLHICGRWTREWLMGNVLLTPHDLEFFQRVQLNFHAERTPFNRSELAATLKSHAHKEFIFQLDGAGGNHYFDCMLIDGVRNLVGLFDISGGAGVLPDAWPTGSSFARKVQPDLIGYAGGLGPNNLAAQLPLILGSAGETDCWVDMETRVRSDDDQTFDLDKVHHCLDIARQYVEVDPS